MATVWGYNSDSGEIDSAPDWLFWPAFHSGIGWHGPFKSKEEAYKFYEDNKDKNPGWKAPTESISTGITNQLGLPDVQSPEFQDKLNTWLLRIGEIVLGVVLIAVGFATLTGAGNLVTKAAKVL